MSKILDGKSTADRICAELKMRLDSIRHELAEQNEQPRLVIVTSGDDEASKVYVRNKVKRCEEIGIQPIIKHFDMLSIFDVYDLLDTYNMCPMIFQMPITGDVDLIDIRCAVEEDLRDVDGFVDGFNVAQLASGFKGEFLPCTPKGVMRLLREYDIDVDGKSVCIIGRSNIVGRPLLWMMEQEGATVTLCHSHTPERTLYQAVAAADIVVSATGVRKVIEMDKLLQYASWNATDKVFVDVGMNRDENGKLCGDIDPQILQAAAAYTPVPGGVGPMTVAMLMENVVQYYESMVI